MKPFGREKIVSQNPSWKKDYHCHNKKHRKLRNWWEERCDFMFRSAMKQIWKKKIENDLNEN
jgi:hypothetical protein